MSCDAIGRHLLSNPSHLELHLFQEAQYCIQRFGKDTTTWIHQSTKKDVFCATALLIFSLANTQLF